MILFKVKSFNKNFVDVEVWDKGFYYFGLPIKQHLSHEDMLGSIWGTRDTIRFLPNPDLVEDSPNLSMSMSAQLMTVLVKYINYIKRRWNK